MENLPVVDEFIYLGIRLTKKGIWGKHIESVEKREQGNRNGSK